MAVVTIDASSISGGDTAPNAPSGLTTEKEWDGVRLHWTNPSNRDIAYIEVWRATTNNRASATLVAEVKANDYVDHSLETGTRYYWIRSMGTTGLTSDYYPTSATGGVSGIPDQVDPTGAVDRDVLQYNSATDSWTTGALRDGTLIKGALQASTDSSYSFPAPALGTITNNNGLDAVSSFPSGYGNGVQGQFTHYFGDTFAANNTAPVFAFNSANGNSSTSGTIPWTGASPVAASGLVTNQVMGGLNFNGYATTNFGNRVATSGQGGGFNAVHAVQLQAFCAESFADGTLTITPTSVTRTSVALSSVSVTGTRGQITFTSSPTPSVGQAVLVTGTNTGASTGISAGVYYMVAATGTTGCTLSATPGGVPITTTPGSTTGLSFFRQFITVGFATQSNIPFGANSKITIANITGVTNGTYQALSTSTTSSVNIGVSTSSVSLGASPTLSCPTVTNMGAGYRIRALPTATTANGLNRLELVNHTAASATHRADTFTIAGGAYGNTGANRVQIDATSVTVTPELVLANANTTRGGAGYASMIAMTNQNAGATNINKYIRMNSTGNLEIINSAYTSNIFTLTDSGDLTTTGSVAIAGGFFKYASYTATALRAITGQVGWTASVNTSGGKLAYWDTANTRWSFVADDSAV